MILLRCPFLHAPVRLSAEREAHILDHHTDLDPPLEDALAEVLAEPDEIRWSASDESILLFCRWYPVLLGGKHIVVAVVLDRSGRDQPWIITAYVARKLRAGALAWRRS